VEAYMTSQQKNSYKTFAQKDLWRYYRLQDNITSLETSGKVFHELLDKISHRISERTELLIILIFPIAFILSTIIIIVSFVSSSSAQKLLQQAHDELEVKVQERTMDLRETQERLIQSEKLAVIGQLTAGVAHEINNPLGFVRSNVYRLKEYLLALTELKRKYEIFKKEFEQEGSPESLKKAYQKVVEMEKEENQALTTTS
jgi:C4-dicarboxylate-specific signal transduction histidine kinase